MRRHCGPYSEARPGITGDLRRLRVLCHHSRITGAQCSWIRIYTEEWGWATRPQATRAKSMKKNGARPVRCVPADSLLCTANILALLQEYVIPIVHEGPMYVPPSADDWAADDVCIIYYLASTFSRASCNCTEPSWHNRVQRACCSALPIAHVHTAL